VKAIVTGVSTRMAAGAAMTPGFGSTTEGFWPVARSSVAGFHAQTAGSSSDGCRFTPPAPEPSADVPLSDAGGCPFASRCPDVMEVCRSVMPPTVQLPQRAVAFHSV